MIAYPTGLHRRLEQRRMRRALASAAAVVMNTPEATRQLTESFPELAERKVVCIPNGYDAADFAGPPPGRTDGKFRIVHVGSLHTEQGEEHRRTMALRKALGGTLGDVDILPRSHVYLMQALDRLVAEEPELGETIELHLGGDLSDADRNAIRSPLVRTPGYLAHAESVALVRSADLLFLPMHDLAAGRRARIVPGKTYEYLASGRPILGAVPAGDANDLLRQAPAGHVCAPTDVDCMVRAIRVELERKRRGEPAPPDQALLARYERRELAQRLADVLHEVVGDARPSAARAVA
jgi:glycosyltransferase involved in cell wall biosynthesis